MNTPTGVIFLAADVVDLIDEGHTGQAGLVAAVGAVFSAPTLKLLKITGKNATLRLSGRDYVISATLRDGIIEASTKATRYERMVILRPLIESGDLTAPTLRLLFDSKSGLLNESRDHLKKNMIAGGRAPPPNTAAHHYLCYHPSQDLELKFLLTGLCPNDARFGVWMDTGLHQALHGKGLRGQGWGPGGPWNYQ